MGDELEKGVSIYFKNNFFSKSQYSGIQFFKICKRPEKDLNDEGSNKKAK